MIALADAIGVDRATVYLALRDPSFPIEEDGSVDPDEARAWFARRRADGNKARGRRDGVEPKPEDESLVRSLHQKQVEYRAAKIEGEKLRIAQLRGELVARAEIAELMAGWTRQFAKSLMLVEGRMAHLLTPEARERLGEEHRMVLQAFADAGSQDEDDAEVPDDEP